jgi:hypothetical protein
MNAGSAEWAGIAQPGPMFSRKMMRCRAKNLFANDNQT